MIRRPTQGMKMKALSRGALLAFSLASVPQFGFAASPAPLTPPREDLPPSEPEVAPRGRHAPRDINYSQWRKLCFKAPGKEALCRTTITGTWATGQMAIRLDLIEREGASRLQILLPVGLYLQAGGEIATRHHIRRNSPSLFLVLFERLCRCGAHRQERNQGARRGAGYFSRGPGHQPAHAYGDDSGRSIRVRP